MLYIVLECSQISCRDATCCANVDSPSKQHNNDWKQWSHGKKNRHTHLRVERSDGSDAINKPSGDRRAGPGKPHMQPQHWNSPTQWKQTWRLPLWKGQRLWQEAEVFTSFLTHVVFMLHWEMRGNFGERQRCKKRFKHFWLCSKFIECHVVQWKKNWKVHISPAFCHTLWDWLDCNVMTQARH